MAEWKIHRKHEKQYCCYICSLDDLSLEEYNRHVEENHTKEEGRQDGTEKMCQTCGLWTRQDSEVGKCNGRIMNGLTNKTQCCSEYKQKQGAR